MRSRTVSEAPPRLGVAPQAAHAHFLLTMLWSADPALAARADRAGIDRVGVDLESIGKAERQRGLGTHVSSHRIEDLDALRLAVRRGELFCRVNPIHAGSRDEVEDVLARGVDVVMLPMFTTAAEVATLVALVRGRAKVVPLVEHRLAAEAIEAIVAVPGLDCVHVGLTDLALSMQVANRFSLLASTVVDRVASVVRSAGLRLCIGGIGRAQDDALPIPTDLVYAQYAVLGATGALVSRSFFGPDPASVDLEAEVRRCRERIAHWQHASAAERASARREFARRAASSPAW